MTQKQFNDWPLNLSPWQVRQVLGVNANALRELCSARPDLVTRRQGKGKRFFSKAKIAELAKLKYE